MHHGDGLPAVGHADPIAVIRSATHLPFLQHMRGLLLIRDRGCSAEEDEKMQDGQEHRGRHLGWNVDFATSVQDQGRTQQR